MNERIKKLREQSVSAQPSLSIERAVIETRFYRENDGKYPVPVMRALNFYELCKKKTIYIGEEELIVGERGPRPKAVPTFPELTCHTAEDFRILRDRELQNYTVSDREIAVYEKEVIPYWKGRTQRERIFNHVPDSWKQLYEAGVFTEFMEQRAPGHTALDGKIYRMGLMDFKAQIARALEKLDFLNDPVATDRQDQLRAMDISCDAVILFAGRHADLADLMADRLEREAGGETVGGESKKDCPGTEDTSPAGTEVEMTQPERILAEKRRSIRARIKELREIAAVCRRVPAYAPQTFHQAIQMYWFVHLATVTELNGWDAMNPGHFDQHLQPFYDRELAAGTLTRERAKELLSCFWIKVNNHPAPPKVGVTAKESGTYNDFTNINLGGVRRDGSSGVSDLSYLFLEVIRELHILQPGSSVHISSRTPDRFLNAACKVIRKGYGYPSVFNADAYVQQMIRQGKSLEDAREGGCSGCIETGAFGKEAYLLTGYLNVPKILELALHNGLDPLSGRKISIPTGDPRGFAGFEDLYRAFTAQLDYVVEQKISVSNYIDRMFAKYAPAPFLSVLIEDCISKGRDYYDGGPRYNTGYIQCTGLGTVTDSLSAIKKHVYEEKTVSMDKLLEALSRNFAGEEVLRQILWNHTPFFGNDLDFADSLAVRVYEDLFRAIDGRPNIKGGQYHMNMLSTTCHIYFGKMTGATPNGRPAAAPISDGTSPSQGCDTNGPSAVIKSLGKLDQIKSGGTLLNQRFIPALLKKEEDVQKLCRLIRSYFSMGGHHIQFNIVDTATLRDAQLHPQNYRDLMVRMAGYSDYFNDMNGDYQEEIIRRTENAAF